MSFKMNIRYIPKLT